MLGKNLSPEASELLVYIAGITKSNETTVLAELPRLGVQELVNRGFAEYQSGSRQSRGRPRFIVLTADGRKLAKQILHPPADQDLN